MIWACPCCGSHSHPDGRQYCNCSVEDQERAVYRARIAYLNRKREQELIERNTNNEHRSSEV